MTEGVNGENIALRRTCSGMLVGTKLGTLGNSTRRFFLHQLNSSLKLRTTHQNWGVFDGFGESFGDSSGTEWIQNRSKKGKGPFDEAHEGHRESRPPPADRTPILRRAPETRHAGFT